jgi:hypothetical protein
MHVELLWWEGCPSAEEALADLRRALAENGFDPDAVVTTEVVSDDDAERESFIGSPTIRLDGIDVVPPPDDARPALNCRVYRMRDGRYSPTPDPDDLRDAIARRRMT